MWPVKYRMTTQNSLYVTTSAFSNLANNDFSFQADLLIWQETSGETDECELITPPPRGIKNDPSATLGCPRGYLRLRGNNNATRSLKMFRPYYHSFQKPSPKTPQSLCLFKHLKVFQQPVLFLPRKKTLHRLLLGTRS